MAKYKAVYVENTLNGHDGKWAVGHGKKYFVWAVFDTKEEAEKQAVIETMRYHYDQIQEQREVLAKIEGVDSYDINWHDYVA